MSNITVKSDGSGITVAAQGPQGIQGTGTVDPTKLPLAGGTMSGDIDMDGNQILNQFSGLSDPGVLTGTTWEPLRNYVDENIFTYSTTTTEADPGSGNLRLNNVNLSLATELYVSDTTSQGANIDLFIDAAVSGTVLTLREFGDFTKDIIFSVQTSTDNTTWFKFEITVIQSSSFTTNGVNLLFRALNIPVTHDDSLEGLGTIGSPLIVTKPTIQSVSSSTVTHVVTDSLHVLDTSSNNITDNLLAASLWTGRTLNIKKTSSLNKITIDPNGAELIDGASTFDFFNDKESISIISDGTGVYIV